MRSIVSVGFSPENGRRPVTISKHGTDTENVCTAITLMSQHLFRTHVRHGPHDRSRCRTHDGVGTAADRLAFRAADLGQSEVHYLSLAARRDENVVRLDVPMHNTLGVGGVKGIDNLTSQF